MPITRILDITVVKPLTGRMLGYGHFIFESAAQAQGLRHIRYVGEPDAGTSPSSGSCSARVCAADPRATPVGRELTDTRGTVFALVHTLGA